MMNGTMPAGSRRVLVVDDNWDVAAMLTALVKLVGYDVRTAHDGADAVEQAEEYRPHIILMDIGMPRLSGLDAARRIRRQPAGASVRLIAITGWGQEMDRQRSKEAGFDLHLVKPVEMDELFKVLEANIGVAVEQG